MHTSSNFTLKNELHWSQENSNTSESTVSVSSKEIMSSATTQLPLLVWCIAIALKNTMYL